MNNVYIRRSASVLPNEPVSSDQMESVLGQIGDQASRERRLVLSKNGIKQRYYALDPQTRELTTSNAELTALAVAALQGDDFSLQDIDVLACGTTSPDQLAPGHGVMVHGELPDSANCEVVSLSGICCAGVASLRYAYMSVLSGQASTAVATGSELSSSFMRSEQFEAEYDARAADMEARPELAFDGVFLRWMLSDGAGAMLLADQPAKSGLSLKVEWIELRSYANQMDTCMYAGGVKQADGSVRGWRDFAAPQDALDAGAMTFHQDVKQLNENVIEYTVEKALAEVLKKHPMQPDEVDWFLPHFSSDYFRDKVHAGMQKIGFDVPQSRWFTNLADVGNVGSASMYLMLDQLINSGQLKAGQTVLCFVPESGRFSAGYVYLRVVDGEQ
ncbi:MAG: beta-ketoacyl-ACP synthase III [Oceanococcus sp.]